MFNHTFFLFFSPSSLSRRLPARVGGRPGQRGGAGVGRHHLAFRLGIQVVVVVVVVGVLVVVVVVVVVVYCFFVY